MHRPNILIILSDEQRYDTLGCTGNSVARTPNLDGLAERGTVFDYCYTPFPLCCPARASLWTSRMPHNHHVVGNWFAVRPEYRNDGLICDFAQAGYHTIYSGKWHMPGTKPERIGFADWSAIPAVVNGRDRGRYIEDYRRYLAVNGYELIPGSMENLTPQDKEHLHRAGKAPCGRSAVRLEHYLEPWQTRQFLGNLRRRPKDRPFFAVTSYSAPHFPMIVPAPYDRLIDPEAIELPENFCESLEGKPEEIRTCHYHTDYQDLDEGEWRRLIAHYYGFCSLVDAQVGTILKYLRDENVLANTIVVCATDHGDMMGSHGLNQKGHPMHYEETNRVPLIVTHPELRGGVRVGSLVSLMDVLPTLADLTGVSLNGEVEGFSLAGLMEGRIGRRVRDSVLSETFLVNGKPGGNGEYFDPRRFAEERDVVNLSIRTEKEKYVFHYDDSDELYDMESDPGEMRNLIEVPSYGSRKVKLRQRLLADLRDDMPRLAETVVGKMREKEKTSVRR